MAIESNIWFEDILEIPAGASMRIKIDKLIEQKDSEYQRVEVYETKRFGKMLVLDSIVMCTEKDECGYHEMYMYRCTHSNPENVLVIGGGDGGTIREVLKHPSVKNVDICEIDVEVINMCQKHMPTLASAFDDPRVNVYTEDGAKFVKERKNLYDIILVDSSDPIGPAAVLFTEEFYADMRDALTEDGIAATQSESFYYHEDIIEKLTGYAKKLYPVASYYFTVVPTYPSGVIGFTFCSKKNDPHAGVDADRLAKLNGELRYYTADIHKGAFALPAFIKNRIKL